MSRFSFAASPFSHIFFAGRHPTDIIRIRYLTVVKHGAGASRRIRYRNVLFLRHLPEPRARSRHCTRGPMARLHALVTDKAPRCQPWAPRTARGQQQCQGQQNPSKLPSSSPSPPPHITHLPLPTNPTPQSRRIASRRDHAQPFPAA
ncbi:hypothetical protein EJ06DRAFT_260205 [Trichodelitschia bisporula]|uniref:Uncharacterized protein n=1 Tax=Trichodelitschia bisporula TaxID=703511 RepID=A0A6G1HI14_9PEZI|nr:hypothetical protein EJ06DRAFT_260205 [Trichodelitschia bisporula]